MLEKIYQRFTEGFETNELQQARKLIESFKYGHADTKKGDQGR